MELIKIENGLNILDTETASKIVEFEKQMKEIKKQEDALKQLILQEMEDKKILSLKDETIGLGISYIAPTERETLDSKRLREEKPETYDEYINFTPVKSSIRIKVE